MDLLQYVLPFFVQCEITAAEVTATLLLKTGTQLIVATKSRSAKAITGDGEATSKAVVEIGATVEANTMSRSAKRSHS